MALIMVSLLAASARADDEFRQPYIDDLRATLPELKNTTEPRTVESPDPFIQGQRSKLPAGYREMENGESYIDFLKRTDPNAGAGSDANNESYIQKEQERLTPLSSSSDESRSAIADYHSGKKLKPNMGTNRSNHAVAVTIGTALSRSVTGSAAASGTTFSNVYQSSLSPTINFSYEIRPFDHDWLGSLGFVFGAGLTYQPGVGVFQFNLTKPSGALFGAQSNTKLQFFTAPVIAGVNYRMSLARYVRPYVQAAPSMILYYESRNDNVDGHRGYSRGVLLSGGVNFLMDWVDKKSSWDLYDNNRYKHYYLTIDYSRLTTLAGDIVFAVQGLSAGLTFEF